MSPTLPQIVLLSVVQGIAEPLPVSSSAHVIAAERIMHLDPSSPEMLFLLAMLHTGTVLAVILYFWDSWKRRFFSSAERFKEGVARIALATVATLGVYFLLDQLIKRTLLHGRPGAKVEDLFSNLPLIAAALAAGGVLILVAGLRSGSASAPAATEGSGPPVSTGSAFWIGIMQGIVLPFRGLSRSGATISTGMLLGVPRRVSEEFSFALAVVITPPVIAREALGYYKARAAEPGTLHLAALATPGLIGMACSFGAGLIALRWLSGWLEKGRWHYFGIYCLVASAGVLALSRMGY
jgi:undecaprenyl-diphosphatase